MAEDKLSFLDEPDVPDAPAPEPVVEQAADPTPSPARDERGRFAAAEHVETGDPTPDAPPASVPKQEHAVPVAAVTAEREKRQAAERQLAEHQQQMMLLQRQMLEMQARAMAPKPAEPETIQVPDPVTDPEGYAQFVYQQADARIAAVLRARADEDDQRDAWASQEAATREYGEEAVSAALEAARAANVVGNFIKGRDRWQRMVQWHRQQQVLSETGGDLAGYRSRIEAETRQAMEAQIRSELMAQAGIRPAPSAPPPSIAAAPGISPRTQPAPGESEAFSDAFARRRKA